METGTKGVSSEDMHISMPLINSDGEEVDEDLSLQSNNDAAVLKVTLETEPLVGKESNSNSNSPPHSPPVGKYPDKNGVKTPPKSPPAEEMDFPALVIEENETKSPDSSINNGPGDVTDNKNNGALERNVRGSSKHFKVSPAIVVRDETGNKVTDEVIGQGKILLNSIY